MDKQTKDWILGLELRIMILERLIETIVKESHLYVVNQKLIQEIQDASMERLMKTHGITAPTKGNKGN